MQCVITYYNNYGDILCSVFLYVVLTGSPFVGRRLIQPYVFGITVVNKVGKYSGSIRPVENIEAKARPAT